MPPRTVDGTSVGGDENELVEPVYSDRNPAVSLDPVGDEGPAGIDTPDCCAALACCLAAARSFASVKARL